MKAARVHALGEAPRIDEVEVPVAIHGRTIVEMQAATVGHIDRTVWSGNFFQHPPLPYIPGVEAAGIVRASERFAVGERVWLRGAGLGIRQDGTWCEFIDAPDAAIDKLPDAVSMPLGSAFFSPCTSAWVALQDVARLQPGERLLVTGASGAVGGIAVQLALGLGSRVYAVVNDAAQARRLPAGVAPVLQDRLADAQVCDALIDTVGGAVLAAALPRVAPGGRAVLVGYTAGPAVALDLPAFLQRDVALLPLNMMRREAAGRAAVPELLARLADGRLSLEVQTFPLHQAQAALARLAQRGHHGRAVLVPPG
ncbi:MAG: zinc-binding alcohol dehydrogenase family protein [Ramlibacter sp.]